MKSRTTEGFRHRFARLPKAVQELARRTYQVWLKDNNHPSLSFKRIHTIDPIYAVRIGIHWRALAVVRSERTVWFWIGSHAEYDNLIQHL